MTFTREGLIGNRAELEPIFAHHWDDVTPDFEDVRLNFDWDTYSALEKLDAIHFMVAREESDAIAGYQCCIIRPHIHSKDSIVATTTFFFMLPEHRKGWAGVQLFKETERSLKELGITNLYVGCKADRNLAPLFGHLGYHQVETIYAKVLA